MLLRAWTARYGRKEARVDRDLIAESFKEHALAEIALKRLIQDEGALRRSARGGLRSIRAQRFRADLGR